MQPMPQTCVDMDETNTRWRRHQLRQTLVGTGVVGAVIGVVPWLALLLLGSGRTAAHARPLLLQALDAGLFVLTCVVVCIVAFGLLPMLVQYAFVGAMRRWTGRD